MSNTHGTITATEIYLRRSLHNLTHDEWGKVREILNDRQAEVTEIIEKLKDEIKRLQE